MRCAFLFLTLIVLVMPSDAFAQTDGQPDVQPAPQPQSQPAEFVRETHDAWDIRCETAAPENCFMLQVGYSDAGNPLIELTLVRLPPGGQAAAGATAIVPLGTALAEGVVLQVDGGERRRFDYDFCTPAGCAANLAFTADQVTALQAGLTATVTVVPASQRDRPISAAVSLKGFTAAYRALGG